MCNPQRSSRGSLTKLARTTVRTLSFRRRDKNANDASTSKAAANALCVLQDENNNIANAARDAEAEPRTIHMPCAACGQVLSVAAPETDAVSVIDVTCPRCQSGLRLKIRPHAAVPRAPTWACAPQLPAGSPPTSENAQLPPHDVQVPNSPGSLPPSSLAASGADDKQKLFLNLEREISRIAAEEGDVSIPAFLPLPAHPSVNDGSSAAADHPSTPDRRVNRFLAYAQPAGTPEGGALSPSFALSPDSIRASKPAAARKPSSLAKGSPLQPYNRPEGAAVPAGAGEGNGVADAHGPSKIRALQF